MRISFARRIAALCVAALLGSAAQAQTPPRILLDGSTGVMPLAAALAKAYEARYPGAEISMGTGLGTKARIQALAEGKIDIALASHGLDFAEIARQGMSAHEIARVPVVMGVNAAVPVAALTEQQICDLYAGKTSNWSDVGGPVLAVAARTRPDSEVDAEVFRAHLPCLKDLRMPDGVKVMSKSGDMARELAATPGAMGMTTMTVVEQSGGRVRAVAINGVAPTPEAVGAKSYRLVRESYFVVKTPASADVTRFLEFVRGPAGAEVIRANGAIPVR